MSEAAETVGIRMRRYRDELGWSLSKLAEESGVSKGYLSEIENGEAARLSGDKLYAIANALGVNMSDLLGRQLINKTDYKVPPELRSFADEQDLPEADVKMLATIKFRGEKPKSKERWALIYSAIKSSEWMDKGDRKKS